jgi:hypothetical protein
MNTTLRRGGVVRGDSGAVAVIVALLLSVFILFAALVVDVGYWYNVRRQLQSAADGAALAGCWEVIKSGDKAAALNLARTYAAKNAVAPADGLEMVEPGPVNPATGHAYTEITDDYVKVTVRKSAPAFFSAILGYSGGWITAQSRADAEWLSGINAVPWSVPIIATPTRVTVSVGGGSEQTMTKGADGKWRRYGTTVGRSAASGAYSLTFTVYNSLGVPTPIGPVAGVVVRESTAPFTDVWLDRYVVTSGDSAGIDVHVASTVCPSEASFAGNTYKTFSGAAGNWAFHLPSPSTNNLSDSFPLTITWPKQGKAKAYTLNPAAWVVARRSTFPIKDASTSPLVVTSSGGTIDVVLELNEYEYDKTYELKVVKGSDAGNFCAIDLGKIYHPPNTKNPDPEEYDLRDDPDYRAPAYYHYLEYAFPFDLHLGDSVWTQTGNMSGPQTDSALRARFAGDVYTWDSWNAATPPRPPTKRLVYVPVVEEAERVTGQSRMLVVGLTSFFIEPASSYADTIRGRFVEYVAGGQGSTTPPPTGYGVKTPRLVSTDIDF